MSEEKEYDLTQSKKKLGYLLPVIEDAFGNIIDGFHRLKVDPDWPRVRLQHIDDPIKLEKARIAMNQCRRIVDAEERSESYARLIDMAGWTPKELSENMGIPYRTVIRYLPKEFKGPEPPQLASAKKNKWYYPHKLREEMIEKLGSKCMTCGSTENLQFAHIYYKKPRRPGEGGHGHLTIYEVAKHPEDFLLLCKGCHDHPEPIIREYIELIASDRLALRPLVECARCHMADRNCQEYGGEILCLRCLELAKYKPEKVPLREPSAPKVTTAIIKPKETWEHRRAVMTPQVSKMEEAVLVKLEQKGLHPEVQKEFCLRSTRPDYYFPQQNLAIFLDGPVHKGREDRDEAIRELLQRRCGVTPLGIAYEGTSQAELDEIVNKIVEATEQRSQQQ